MIKLSQKFDVIMIDIEAHMKSEHNQKPYHIAWTRSNALDKTAPMECYEWYVKEFLHPTMWKHTFIDKATGERKDCKCKFLCQMRLVHIIGIMTLGH